MLEILELETKYFPFIQCQNLKLYKGDVVKIEGKSGCGKSTFLKAIAGLKSIQYDKFTFDKRKIVVGQVIYLNQAVLNSNLTVFEYVNKINSFKLHKNKKIKLELLTYLKESFLDKNINQLSGGQKQLVSISLAISLEAKLILMDESFSGIDHKKQNLIVNFIKKYHPELIIIYTAHNITALDNLISKKLKIENVDNIIKVVPV